MKGPYNSSINQPYLYKVKTWYRTDNGQKKRSPLPFYSIGCRNLRVSGWWDAVSDPGMQQLGGYNGSWYPGLNFDVAYNRAYNKFRSRIGQQAAQGTNIVQYQQTIDLLASLIRSARNPFKAIAKELRRVSRDPRKFISDVSSSYLAIHFGLVPLIQDVYAACQILSSDIPSEKISVSSSLVSDQRTYTQGFGYPVCEWSFDLRVRISARVSVTNPNLYLAQSMGLVNPLTIAWDLVPFSFVVDWFYPVSSFLNSFSDLLGLDLKDAYWTKYGRCLNHFHSSRAPYSYENYFSSYVCDRQLGLVEPFPAIISKPLSISHATTSVALLIQQLDRFRSMR